MGDWGGDVAFKSRHESSHKSGVLFAVCHRGFAVRFWGRTLLHLAALSSLTMFYIS